MIIALTCATCSLLAATPAHADQWRDKQWHLDFLKAEKVHGITEGEGSTVAVVDSGVDAMHPDLKGNVKEGADLAEGGNGWKDTSGHGTGMASLIAGHGHGPGNQDGVLGLAPKAKILPARDESSARDATSEARAAFKWAANHGADVINFSAFYGGMRTEVERALDSEAVVVASAGNTAQGAEGVQPPASYPGVIAVSGLDRDGNFTDESVQGPEVVLSAPAVDITYASAGARGTYHTATGTSGAAALVSATAALVRAKFPDLSAGGVINRLIKTAIDKGPKGRDPQYGFGVVNPLGALTEDVPDVDHNPLLGPGGGSPPPRGTTLSGNTDDAAAKDSSGALLPPLLGVGGLIALALIAFGVVYVVRNRRTSPNTGPTPWQPPTGMRPEAPYPHGPPGTAPLGHTPPGTGAVPGPSPGHPAPGTAPPGIPHGSTGPPGSQPTGPAWTPPEAQQWQQLGSQQRPPPETGSPSSR